MAKPKVGIFGLSGCWGEQIVILNCEDELLDIIGAVEIIDFLGGSSVNDTESPLDIAFVEGSVSNAKDEETLLKVRKRAKLLVACGSCACFGGVPAMRSILHRKDVINVVYGDKAPQYDIREHRPLSDFVKVDLAIPGCPMEKHDFLNAVASLLNGDIPHLPKYSVCGECKMNENECLLVEHGIPCLGSVTVGGCGARCPNHGVPCIGCRGPVEQANYDYLKEILQQKGYKPQDAELKFSNFGASAVDKVREQEGG